MSEPQLQISESGCCFMQKVGVPFFVQFGSSLFFSETILNIPQKVLYMDSLNRLTTTILKSIPHTVKSAKLIV